MDKSGREEDPYLGKSDIFQLLGKANVASRNRELWGHDFDKLMYLPNKEILGAGGVASDNVNVSQFGNMRVMVHELGHNFSSRHTHNCDWPEGLLDYCYPAEGRFYDQTLEKRLGTIMSYSQSHALTFHPYVQAVIRKHTERILQDLKKSPPVPFVTDECMNSDNQPFTLFEPCV